jgi:hypothetical protein
VRAVAEIITDVEKGVTEKFGGVREIVTIAPYSAQSQ